MSADTLEVQRLADKADRHGRALAANATIEALLRARLDVRYAERARQRAALVTTHLAKGLGPLGPCARTAAAAAATASTEARILRARLMRLRVQPEAVSVSTLQSSRSGG